MSEIENAPGLVLRPGDDGVDAQLAGYQLAHPHRRELDPAVLQAAVEIPARVHRQPMDAVAPWTVGRTPNFHYGPPPLPTNGALVGQR